LSVYIELITVLWQSVT